MVVRHISLDADPSLPLVCTSYLGHPPSVDGTGVGIAKTLLEGIKEIGLTESQIRLQLRAANYDGALLNTHVNDFHCSAFCKECKL